MSKDEKEPEIGILNLDDVTQFKPDEDESKVKILIDSQNPKRKAYIWLKRPNPKESISYERTIPRLRDKTTPDFFGSMILYLTKFGLQPKFTKEKAEEYLLSRPRQYFKELQDEMLESMGVDRKELTKEAIESALKN